MGWPLCALISGLMSLLIWAFAASSAMADDPKVPPQPADPSAAKAYAVLDAACAMCHQTEKIKTLKQPAGNLGNILDLEALARMPSLIVPGIPDASPLYASIHARAMPPDGAADAGVAEITAADLGVVRDWIEQLPPLPSCTAKPPISPDMLATAVDEAVNRLGAARARSTRFIAVAAQHNTCATTADMEAVRAAVTYLINALSLGLDPVKLPASGPSDVLLEIDLAAIGWSAEQWDRLAYRAPAAAFTPISAELQKATATRVPLVDAGWFADATTQAPLYYELIGMPETLKGLMASLRIDLTADRRDAVERIALKSSTVARGSRLIERRAFANGAAWFSNEFAPTAGRPDLFDQTIAAATSSNRPTPQLQPDATLLHVDLPNGFPAYYAANASGARIHEIPGSILKDDGHPSRSFAATQSCLGCHSGASTALIRGRTDDLKSRLQSDTTLSKEVREKLLATHPEPADWQRRLDDDAQRLSRALAAAGLDASRKLDGLEPLPGLIARYQRAVSVTEIASLAGVPPQRILDLGISGSAALADVASRLAFAPVPRAAVDAVLPEIAQRLGLSAPGGSQAAALPAIAAGSPELVLKAERAVYQAGDLLAVSVRSSINCHLTLLTLDAKGRATVLFPNEFDPDPTLEAGREVRFPSEKAPFQFRLREKGHETLIGICTASGKSVDGIRHDYEKQRFTELGDYRAFLSRSWSNRDGAEARPVARNRTPRKPGDIVDAATGPLKPDPQVRTAVRIRIE